MDFVDFRFWGCNYLCGHLGKQLEKSLTRLGKSLSNLVINYHIEMYTWPYMKHGTSYVRFFFSNTQDEKCRNTTPGQWSFLVSVPAILFEVDSKASEFFFLQSNIII